MNKTNLMYKMFKQMKEGYKSKQDGLFEHAVRCWMDVDPEDPFEEGTEASEYFSQMKIHYNVWKMKSSDYRVNWRRMLESARKLCALNPRQPYKFDKKAEEEDMLEEQRKLAEQKKIDEQKAEEQRRLEEEAKAKVVVVKEEPVEEVDYTKAPKAEPLPVEKPIEKVSVPAEKPAEKPVEKAIEKEEPQHIFGIIPEKKPNIIKRFFGRFKK